MKTTNKTLKKKMNPKSLANLHPCKPGERRNPSGRPKKEVSITAQIRKRLDEVPDVVISGKKNTRPWSELVAESILMNAYKGSGTALHELLERVEGKVVTPIGSEEGKPITFKFVIGDSL